MPGQSTRDVNGSTSSGRVELDCIHCGLPTPCAFDTDPSTVFCCNGCRGAYDLIHGWGLQDYYALRDQVSGSPAGPAGGEKSRYDAFDSDAFLGDSAPRLQSDGMATAEFAVHGLHCAACAWLIENAAARTSGWQSARVQMSDHTLRVMFDPSRIVLSQIARLMDRLGYELAPLAGKRHDHFRIENRRLLMQIAVAGFCAMNAMWIAIALYAGDASGVEANHRFFLRVIGTGLGVVAVLIPGRTFFRGALASLRTRTPHMDLPVALGLSVGTIAGLASAVSGRGDVYFDSLAVLVFLLLIGRWIQFRQQHRAAKAVDLLLRVTPMHAQRVTTDGATEWVLVDVLAIDDVIRVAAGESIAADGYIVAGETMLDRSLLTGESQPVGANQGDEVSAGTINLVRSVDVRVAATGRDSRIGKVMQSVELAASTRTPIVQLADRIGGVFVVVVTFLALLVMVVWWSSGWELAAAHATSLLIVACPCALALATPLAIAVSLGRAAKQKILIRDGSSLQQLAKPGTLWFDKTGTLTQGRPTVELIFGSDEAVRLAAQIERGCCHPTAEAIVRFVGQGVDTWPDAKSEFFRNGVIGVVDGLTVAVGNVDFMEQQSVLVGDPIFDAICTAVGRHASPVVIGVNGEAVAVVGVADPLKPHAAETIQELQRLGFRVGILSGDHRDIVDRVAVQLGVDSELAHGGLSPEDKLSIVQQRSDGNVVMVGDGANDAAALAAADVGIAVRGGAEVSLQAAPVFIASGELTSVISLIGGARRTSWLIVVAFTVSLAYNIVAVGLAMCGIINPLLAAILMPISSVSVLTLTLLWPTFRAAKERTNS
ncbi:putative copper-importing P-type ATPase A [Rubripirellula tenax]|uniref:Putative copper-importing P-type ATPase A n=1 Tax=Rubripirellula tenax TaxID=2528015 RepID=A0A5C6EFJ3_9BACT|nr:heavy metal translocating P-type ATPase metal-binding domain-containing protein [Rubripirellula tenax]TWU47350.1 putative copper-importing P-type ATPase A [Rubripirellula tenax]